MVNSQGICGLGYNEEKLISTFCLANFSTRKTALEILKDFENTDKIIRKDGVVYSRRFFNPDLTVKEETFVPESSEQEAQKEIDKILAKEDAAHDKILDEVKV